MTVRLVTLRRASGSSSFRIYTRKLEDALRAARPDGAIEVTELDMGGEGRRGGVIRPTLGHLFRGRPRDGSIWHATEPNTALRGVDVVTIHDLYPFTVPGLMFRIFRSVLRRSARRARRIVVETEVVRADVRRYLGDAAWAKSRIVPPPFPTPPWGRAPDAYDLLWLGSLERRKQPVRFLRQLAEAPAPRRRVAFLCHRGGFGDAAEVERAVADARRAHAVEWITRDVSAGELDRLYRSSRAFVSTSSLEGYHYPVMEAWSRGTPAVVPRIEPYVQIYGSVAGIHFYDPAGSFVPTADQALDAPPYAPDAALLRSVSREGVGAVLWSLYGEVEAERTGRR